MSGYTTVLYTRPPLPAPATVKLFEDYEPSIPIIEYRVVTVAEVPTTDLLVEPEKGSPSAIVTIAGGPTSVSAAMATTYRTPGGLKSPIIDFSVEGDVSLEVPLLPPPTRPWRDVPQQFIERNRETAIATRKEFAAKGREGWFAPVGIMVRSADGTMPDAASLDAVAASLRAQPDLIQGVIWPDPAPRAATIAPFVVSGVPEVITSYDKTAVALIAFPADITRAAAVREALIAAAEAEGLAVDTTGLSFAIE